MRAKDFWNSCSKQIWLSWYLFFIISTSVFRCLALEIMIENDFLELECDFIGKVVCSSEGRNSLNLRSKRAWRSPYFLIKSSISAWRRYFTFGLLDIFMDLPIPLKLLQLHGSERIMSGIWILNSWHNSKHKWQK